MKTIEKTKEYLIVEFDDDDYDEDKDIDVINYCTKNERKYEFINEDETQIKIWR